MTFDLTALAEMEKAATHWEAGITTDGYQVMSLDNEDVALAVALRNALPAMLEEIRAAREWYAEYMCLAEDIIEDYPTRSAREAYREIVARNSEGTK